MSVSRVCSPYTHEVCSKGVSRDNSLSAGLEADPQGRVLLSFMNQEENVEIETSANDRLELIVADTGHEFNPDWYETGRMLHGKKFKILVPKGMDTRTAVEVLKAEFRKDEKLRWLMATYVSGVTYMDSLSETGDGVYANGCQSEAMAVKNWIEFSKWLWNDSLRGKSEKDWRLKELVMQDIGVAADRSLVRYESNDSVYSYFLKNPGMVNQGLAAFKDKNATTVGPLKFERLKGKENERVGLAQYQLHSASSGYSHKNMSPTCYQGDLYDLYTEDTNMFHHAIGYIPFYFQMRRFAGSAGDALVQKQISVYEDGRATEMHSGLVLGPAGGTRVELKDGELKSSFFTHKDVGDWYPNGDVDNSMMMVEGARALYNGEMELDELPDFLSSRCTCDEKGDEKVMAKRPPLSELLPDGAHGDGGALNSCSQHLPNTIGTDYLSRGDRFELNKNPRVKAKVEEWKKAATAEKRLEIAKSALTLAPKDAHLNLLYIGTAIEIFDKKRATGDYVDEKWTASLVEKIRKLNVSINLFDMRTIWDGYFDYPLPEVLVKYKQWSKRDCMLDGYCDNPVWDYFGKKYENYCRSAEYNEVNVSGNGITLPQEISSYRNIREAKAFSEIYFEFKDENGKWHKAKYFSDRAVANYMVVDGMDVVATLKQDMFIVNNLIYPNNEKRFVGNVYEYGPVAILSHTMLMGDDDLRLSAFRNWHACLKEGKMFIQEKWHGGRLGISFFNNVYHIDVADNLEFGIYSMDKFIDEKLLSDPETALDVALILADTILIAKEKHANAVGSLSGHIEKLRSQLEVMRTSVDEPAKAIIDYLLLRL